LIFDIDGTFAASAVAPPTVPPQTGTRGQGILLFVGGIGASDETFIDRRIEDNAPPPGDPVITGHPDPLPDVLVIDMPATLGRLDPLHIGVAVVVSTTFGFIEGPATASATVDFDSTFILRHAVVLNWEKNPIPDGTIVSFNNFVYPTAVTPEPSLSLLFVGALAGAIAVRRKRHRPQ
jgi:hypothetical protein